MLALVAKKKLMASARSLGCPAALAPLSNSSSRAVSSLKTFGFPASITFAISRVLGWVPVGRKSTDASFSFATVCAELGDDVGADERLAASLRSRLRCAIRTTMVFVIVAPAGVLKVPPRLSFACCANAGARETNTIRIKSPARMSSKLFLFIFDRPLFQLPPRRSVYSVMAGAQVTSESEIKKQQGLEQALFLLPSLLLKVLVPTIERLS